MVPDVTQVGPGPGSVGPGPAPAGFRQVLGHFCTGVTVITTADAEGPAGFTCQAFAALSLDPPLVLFCPSRLSSTWRRIERTGHFCANVLADGQQELARVFGTSRTDRFTGVRWSPSSSGAPVLDGVLTWLGSIVEAVHEAGDHHVVIGRVTELGDCRPGQPLLFYRGRFAATPARAADEPPEVVDTLLAWPRHTDWI
ncbi:MAG TPA: flavin reductase family protein [Streptosporangiaceae bacterium]|nr:flavin reductase family protein [Streptosporangiaceae bacterium]